MQGAFGGGSGPPGRGNGGGKKNNNNLGNTFRDSDFKPFP